VNRPLAARTSTGLGWLALAAALAGCSTSNLFSGDRVDYHTASVKINPLEVPPDLAQLSKDGRYQPQRGVVSASALPAGSMTRTSVAPSPSKVAPSALGEFKVERDGDQRWLSVPKPPEQVWSQVTSFWQDQGFTLVKNDPAAGVMETNWAENRAKLPQDLIRQTLGSLLDSAYSTSEMDQYRTRIERTANGSEIFITHKGMQEVHTSPLNDATRWEPRPTDPQMEAEMLSRLLVKLGASETMARNAVDNPETVAKPPPRARILTGQPGAALEVDDGLDRAWRRVGLALDRSGFTVEDRDRAAGLYFVRYVDPKSAGLDDTTSFFGKLFGGSSDTSSAAVKYQVALKAEGGKTVVSVLNSQGGPDSGENGKQIVSLLAEQLK
jgi:outer membrane protein assembly factor BamC